MDQKAADSFVWDAFAEMPDCGVRSHLQAHAVHIGDSVCGCCMAEVRSPAPLGLRCGHLKRPARLCAAVSAWPGSERSHTQAPPHPPHVAVRAVREPLLGPGNTPERGEHVALCRVDHECRKQAKHAAG